MDRHIGNECEAPKVPDGKNAVVLPEGNYLWDLKLKSYYSLPLRNRRCNTESFHEVKYYVSCRLETKTYTWMKREQ